MSEIDDFEERRKRRIMATMLAIRGHERYHVIDCEACGQKNRVDAAHVMATKKVPACARCKVPLLSPEEMAGVMK